MKKKYDIKGMGCAACSARIENVIGKMDGVSNVAVNLMTNSMIVDFDEGQVQSDRYSGKLCKTVKKPGKPLLEDNGLGGQDAQLLRNRAVYHGGRGNQRLQGAGYRDPTLWARCHPLHGGDRSPGDPDGPARPEEGGGSESARWGPDISLCTAGRGRHDQIRQEPVPSSKIGRASCRERV